MTNMMLMTRVTMTIMNDQLLNFVSDVFLKHNINPAHDTKNNLTKDDE